MNEWRVSEAKMASICNFGWHRVQFARQKTDKANISRLRQLFMLMLLLLGGGRGGQGTGNKKLRNLSVHFLVWIITLRLSSTEIGTGFKTSTVYEKCSHKM